MTEIVNTKDSRDKEPESVVPDLLEALERSVEAARQRRIKRRKTGTDA